MEESHSIDYYVNNSLENNSGSVKTSHKIIIDDSRIMNDIDNDSIQFVVTSPPYPMIEMWDEMFSEQNKDIEKALADHDDDSAFELMHQELDKVWKEVYRVLEPGCIACINIGDATRKIDNSFKLYSNHARILSFCTELGFHVLPDILWRKQSNKPNKFMGSGMLPVGAYVTLEHEHILILRKGAKREFNTELEKSNRQRSAFFWEERNKWFSDIWEGLMGDRQKLNNKNIRERSAAYPFELAYRLITMFSVQGDIVLDPYLGTSTATLGAMASGRNSIGYEIDSNFMEIINLRMDNLLELANGYNNTRIKQHLDFVKKREKENGKLSYFNERYKFPVMTRQETRMVIPMVKTFSKIKDNIFEIEYA